MVVFVTFSSRRLKEQSTDWNYKKFIKAIENNGLEIVDKWYEGVGDVDPSTRHDQVLKAISECEVFIADTSIDSTGVGQQIAIAVKKKIPTFICHSSNSIDPKKGIFLTGTRARNIHFIVYDSFDDLENKLREGIKKLPQDALEKLNFVASSSIKQYLKEESTRMGISQSELLRKIVEDWRLQRE